MRQAGLERVVRGHIRPPPGAPVVRVSRSQWGEPIGVTIDQINEPNRSTKNGCHRFKGEMLGLVPGDEVLGACITKTQEGAHLVNVVMHHFAHIGQPV